jgi:hypothetical protein
LGISNNAVEFAYCRQTIHLIDDRALSLEPSFGPIAGGTQLLISGGMALGSGVNHVGCTVCGKQTTGTLLSSTSISCETPAMDEKRQCAVMLYSHVDDEIEIFQIFEYYENQIILSVVPSQGPTEGGTVIEILGSHLQTPMMCRFGHNVMAPFFISSSSTLSTYLICFLLSSCSLAMSLFNSSIFFRTSSDLISSSV